MSELLLKSGTYDWENIRDTFTESQIDSLLEEIDIAIIKIEKQLSNAKRNIDLNKPIKHEWYERASGKLKVMQWAKEQLFTIKRTKNNLSNEYYHFYRIAKEYLPKKTFEDIKYLVREDKRKLDLVMQKHKKE